MRTVRQGARGTGQAPASYAQDTRHDVLLMDKYLKRRWGKAQLYKPSQVVYLGEARGGYWNAVQSSRSGWYRTWVKFNDEGELVDAWCECLDFGECKLREVEICKHALAAAIHRKGELQRNSQ